MTYCTLFDDGVLWGIMWECVVDRADRVPSRHKEQWVQKERSVRLCALWVHGSFIEDLPYSTEFNQHWNPLLEMNPGPKEKRPFENAFLHRLLDFLPGDRRYLHGP